MDRKKSFLNTKLYSLQELDQVLHREGSVSVLMMMMYNISLCAGDINTVRYLVCAGAELDQRSATGQTALHLAVLSARIPIAQLLLDQGADFQVKIIKLSLKPFVKMVAKMR